MANKKVVVAFSGGLDTSYTVMKLTQDGWDVYAACANTGGFSAEQLKTNEENAYKLGAKAYVTLDVTHDGTKNGYACQAYSEMASFLTIPVIASGGAGTVAHIEEVLREGKADAALAASIFHYGEIRIPELKRKLREDGINVRI